MSYIFIFITSAWRSKNMAEEKKGGKFSAFINGVFFGLLSGSAAFLAHKNRDKIKDCISDFKEKRNQKKENSSKTAEKSDN